MILSFKERFVPLIKTGDKIHTIRADKHDLWIEGRKIHFWHSNPRNVNGHPYPFEVPDKEICLGIQKIEITSQKYFGADVMRNVFIDGILLSPREVEELAVNDGFNRHRSFFKWFDGPFVGKIIHWTEKRY